MVGNNKYFRIFITCLGLMFTVTAFSVTETRAQGVLKEVLDRMDGNYKTLSSLQSNIKLVKTDTVLGESDTNIGTVSFLPEAGKRPKYVRIDWQKPEENMVLIGDDYKIYRKALNQLIQGKTNTAKSSDKAGNALAFVSMSNAQRKANYNVGYVGQETISGGIETWHVLMTPKTKVSYKTADLWIDKDGMPRQAKVTENNNDTTVILLSGIQKNIKLDANIFKLSPKGATIVRG